MTNLVVISFPNNENAQKGSHKLNDLEFLGDITIYERVMIKKSETGEIRMLESETKEGLRISSGMAAGTLIGIVGGPVGMLAGMLTGTLLGGALENDYIVFKEDIITRVKDRMRPGTIAIVAEINESNPVFIDTAFPGLDVEIFRTDIDYVYQDYEDKEVIDMDEDIANERKKLKSSIAANKSQVNKRIDELKKKREQRIQELRKKHRDEKRLRLMDRIQKHKEKISRLEKRIGKIEHPDLSPHSR